MMETGPDIDCPNTPPGEEHPNESAPITVKTIPSHRPVKLADRADIATIFGEENNQNIFRVGNTREQGHPSVLI